MATLDKSQTSDFKSPLSGSSQGSLNQHPRIPLPLAFRIYCDKARISNAVFYIGREKSERLNAISVRYTRWVYPMVALHAGPSVDSPILGSSVINGKMVDVSLPCGNIQMAGRSAHRSTFAFTLSVGASGTSERFEWRRSRGEEVKRLGSRGAGWELCLMDDPLSNTEEVVAVYSVDLCLPKLSGRFRFLDTKATKELGRDWAIAAVVTALSLGQKQRDTAMATMGLVTAIA